MERTSAEEAAYEEALQAHQQDPKNVAKPSNLMNYEFFLPQDKKTATNFKSMFDVDNPDREDESLYTHDSGSGGCFPFSRVRAYETAQETEMEHAEKYSNEILLAHHDEDKHPRQKAVYYYPVLQKSTIRPQRMKNIARTIGGVDEDETIVERMDVTIEDPSEDQLEVMKRYKEHPFGWQQEEEEEQQQEAEEAQPQREKSEDAEGEDDAQQDRGSSAGRRSKSRDAEGDDEDED